MADRKDNSGALFRNDAKRDAKDRDYSGQAMIGGVEYWVSGYVNVSQKTGMKYLGLTFKPKEAKAAPKPEPGSDWLDDPSPPSGPGGGDFDDRIPFAPM